MHKATQVREHSKLALRWPSEGEGKGHFVCVSVCVCVCVCVCVRGPVGCSSILPGFFIITSHF